MIYKFLKLQTYPSVDAYLLVNQVKVVPKLYKELKLYICIHRNPVKSDPRSSTVIKITLPLGSFPNRRERTGWCFVCMRCRLTRADRNPTRRNTSLSHLCTKHSCYNCTHWVIYKLSQRFKGPIGGVSDIQWLISLHIPWHVFAG